MKHPTSHFVASPWCSIKELSALQLLIVEDKLTRFTDFNVTLLRPILIVRMFCFAVLLIWIISQRTCERDFFFPYSPLSVFFKFFLV